MTALIDKLVQRAVEGFPALKVLGFPFAMRNKPADKPWLIDREGVVYKPSKRVVLRATPKGPIQ